MSFARVHSLAGFDNSQSAWPRVSSVLKLSACAPGNDQCRRRRIEALGISAKRFLGGYRILNY